MEGESICRSAKENWSASDEGRCWPWIWSCRDKTKVNPFQSHDSTISQCSWTQSSKPTWRVTHLGFKIRYCLLIVRQFRFNHMQFHLSLFFWPFCSFLVISIFPFLYYCLNIFVCIFKWIIAKSHPAYVYLWIIWNYQYTLRGSKFLLFDCFLFCTRFISWC